MLNNPQERPNFNVPTAEESIILRQKTSQDQLLTKSFQANPGLSAFPSIGSSSNSPQYDPYKSDLETQDMISKYFGVATSQSQDIQVKLYK